MTFVNIVPRNPLDAAARGDMLGLIFFTLIFGIALTRIPRGEGRAGDPAPRRARRGGDGDHRLRHAAGPARRGGADLHRDRALRLRDAAVARALRGDGARGARRPPVRGDRACWRGCSAGSSPLDFFRRSRDADGDRLLHLQLQRHPPHHHPHGGAPVRRPARDRRLRAPARRDDEHERHRPLRGDDGALPGAGLRRPPLAAGCRRWWW